MLDIKPDLFTDFGNVLKYLSIKKPQKHFENLQRDVSLIEAPQES
jgi:hypothetical protein